MKLWEKGIPTDKKIEQFTVGNDRELDVLLAKYDALGNIGHAKMLAKVGLITNNERDVLIVGLNEILADIEAGNFIIEDFFEDVHSKIEYVLTQKVGEAGKKIHTARSRNDQVLVDVHLYLKNEITEIKQLVKELFDLLEECETLSLCHSKATGFVWKGDKFKIINKLPFIVINKEMIFLL